MQNKASKKKNSLFLIPFYTHVFSMNIISSYLLSYDIMSNDTCKIIYNFAHRAAASSCKIRHFLIDSSVYPDRLKMRLIVK
jgi:hypothetical protein